MQPDGNAVGSARQEGGGQADVFELARLEDEHIGKALHSAMGNKSKAARLLGISRKTLLRAHARHERRRPGKAGQR